VDDRGVVGPPYRAALRLYAIGVERWAEVESHYYQEDILGFRIDKYLNLVFAWCMTQMAGATGEKIEEWIVALDNPFPWESPDDYVSEAAAEAEGAMFMAAMQQLTGG